MINIASDHRVVLTLDAGGTNLRFCAMRAGMRVTETITFSSRGDYLELCLANIVGGFARVRAMCPAPPVAVSFAFPGPTDYPNGIIGDLGHLPGFRGGVALGPMLQSKFGIPVFINNDGDLFALGERIAGFLPHVNEWLEKAGSPKRFHNLLGVTHRRHSENSRPFGCRDDGTVDNLKNDTEMPHENQTHRQTFF